MRIALWLMALFAVAVASALFAGNNHATVTLFFPPHRVDLSLNLVLLVLIAGFVTLHMALRALSVLFGIPQQARQWRLLHKERGLHAALLDCLSHQYAGRFVRARKAAERVLELEQSVVHSEDEAPLSYARRLRTLAHLLAADSAHALQNRSVRDQHFQHALEQSVGRDAQDAREGVGLRAARWAFDDRDASGTLRWLDQLPQGAARRTVAMRLRFKAARLAGQSAVALETSRLLTKHRAFSELAGRSIARGLSIELIRAAHDPVQIQRAWDSLEVAERTMPDVALEASERLLAAEGAPALSRQWLLPVWDSMAQQVDALNVAQRVRLARVLERGFTTQTDTPDPEWLGRIESAQMANPRDVVLQYLAGVVCMRLQLWGKAQQMLRHCITTSPDASLKRDAWLALALMAEQRKDLTEAAHAYREAAKT